MFEHFLTKTFFFKSVHIYMQDAELANSKEKLNFRFFRFYFARFSPRALPSHGQFPHGEFPPGYFPS